MVYTKVESFELNGFEVKTTFADDEKIINDHISSFLRPKDDYVTKVIGFDVEWAFERNDISGYLFKCANLTLCDGNSCLIIRLTDYLSVPASLHNFLRMPNYTFVSCGIKDNLAFLEKEYGIGFRNAVDLGPLAATLMNAPRLSYCGVDELAFLICKLDLREYRPSSLAFKWCSLNQDELILATVNVFSYHMIGSALLGSSNILTQPPPAPHIGLFMKILSLLLIVFSVLFLFILGYDFVMSQVISFGSLVALF